MTEKICVKVTKANSFHKLRTLFRSFLFGGFPGVSVVKNPPASVGDTNSTPDLGKSHML